EITQRSASRSCCTIGSPRSNVAQTPPNLLNNVLMAFGETLGFPALSQIRNPVLVVWTTSLGPTAIFSSDGATIEPVVVMPSFAAIPSNVMIGGFTALGTLETFGPPGRPGKAASTEGALAIAGFGFFMKL